MKHIHSGMISMPLVEGISILHPLEIGLPALYFANHKGRWSLAIRWLCNGDHPIEMDTKDLSTLYKILNLSGNASISS
jgi:hypothetical protein